MKINVSFGGMDISAAGMSVQRKKMDLIAENIANVETTRMDDGLPYRKQFLRVVNKEGIGGKFPGDIDYLNLKATGNMHYPWPKGIYPRDDARNIETRVMEDASPGDIVYMPNHPDANEEGYVQMPNVNIVTEMVDMITATRGFEANLTAFDSSKQIATDSLDI